MSGYSQWITPSLAGFGYFPDPAALAAIVNDLAEAGWIQRRQIEGYDEAMPSYYGSFPGIADESSARRGAPQSDVSAVSDRAIRASHVRSITMMVTDHLLVAPTDQAREANVRCPGCGDALLPEYEPGMSRIVPDSCPSCEAIVGLSSFRDLSCFRFAVTIETWYPPAGVGVGVDSILLSLLSKHAGHAFKEAGQHSS
jgi:hypothetical protein